MVISRLTAKGKINLCLSVFQYLTGLRGLQEGTNRLYRFTKINKIFYQKIAKTFKDLFITPFKEFLFGLPRIEPRRVINIFMISTTLRV